MASVSDKVDPLVRRITAADIAEALSAGLRDFQAVPRYGLAFGALYAAGGIAILLCLTAFGLVYLVYPLAAGFALIGPFVAVGLYSETRLSCCRRQRRGRRKAVQRAASVGVETGAAPRQLLDTGRAPRSAGPPMATSVRRDECPKAKVQGARVQKASVKRASTLQQPASLRAVNWRRKARQGHCQRKAFEAFGTIGRSGGPFRFADLE